MNVIKVSFAKTCRTCYHFLSEPIYGYDGEEINGCGNDRMVVTSVDPWTHRALNHREVVASDKTCPDYLTEQEGQAAE